MANVWPSFSFTQRVPLAEVIDALMLVWLASESDEWNNRNVEIPQP